MALLQMLEMSIMVKFGVVRKLMLMKLGITLKLMKLNLRLTGMEMVFGKMG